jgi:DNA-binding MarR family transcriptional regulator/GNAT superfamily N-acetyltransferase
VDQIERVRDFNRYYTRRLGVLSDHYLGQDRPLGEARLLFEIGDGADLRDLRSRLGLDSGYLSRLLRALTGQGLIEVGPHPADRRVRVATLTEAGRAERRELEERSRAGVAGLLEGLTGGQRARLVEAQEVIRRLLRVAAVTITPVPDDDPDARECLRRYAGELAVRFPAGYDEDELVAPGRLDGTFLLAREEGRPIGCGAWHRLPSPGVAEVRHLWVGAEARGLGLGRRLLEALERDAGARGIRTVRLGTHSSLPEAIALYRSGGYREIGAYSGSPYNELNFEKALRPE